MLEMLETHHSQHDTGVNCCHALKALCLGCRGDFTAHEFEKSCELLRKRFCTTAVRFFIYIFTENK